jgi:acetyl-CoA carboxylase carboxyltransferase component
MHARHNGLVDILDDSEEELFAHARRLVDFLPANCHGTAPLADRGDDPGRCAEELDDVVPEASNKPFDMHRVILPVMDAGSFQELKAQHARSMLIGFARLAGRSVGVVANQPSHLGGLIDIDAAEKAARFVRFCDAFNIPLVTFQDSPAYKIGQKMEQAGIIYNGAKLLHAYAEATVPKVTVIVRKAYAGAYIAMGSQYIGADLVYAWPSAEISSVGPETAASILFRKEIAQAQDPAATTARLTREYHDKYVQPYRAASLRHINDIIEPRVTRPTLIRSLELLQGKTETRPARKHGNIPL